MEPCVVELYQVCSENGPRVQSSSVARGFGFENKMYLKFIYSNPPHSSKGTVPGTDKTEFNNNNNSNNNNNNNMLEKQSLKFGPYILLKYLNKNLRQPWQRNG